MLKKVILAALLVSSAVFAQLPFHIGGRAAVNYGTAYGSDADNANAAAGFNVGVAAKITALPLITIIPGMEIDLRRINVKENYTDDYSNFSDDNMLSIWYLDIPVVARYNIIPLIYVDAGLAFGFNVSSNMHVEEVESNERHGVVDIVKEDVDYSKLTKSLDVGFIVGAGVSVLPSMLDVDFRLVVGLNSFMDQSDEGLDITIKHVRMQLGVTYWFL